MKEKIIIKKEEPLETKTDPLRASFVNVDKHAGPTSNQVTLWAKKILEAEKAGHSGTLDPKAIGVLPVGINKAVKLMPALQKSDKTYVTVIKFDKPLPDEQKIKSLEGKIKQTPPKKSAVKREEREREIYSAELLETKDKKALIKIKCQHGTYIRLIAKRLGGEMQELRRTQAGPFTEETAVSLQDLQDRKVFAEQGNKEKLLEVLHPPEKVVQDLEKVWVSKNAVNSLCYGANLAKPGVTAISDEIKEGSQVALLTNAGEVIGLGEAVKSTEEIIKATKGIIVDTNTIIMEKDKYPKTWNK